MIGGNQAMMESGGADVSGGAEAAGASAAGPYGYIALAALQLYGSYQMSQITRENGELQDKIADFNSQFAELDAFNARAKGQGDAARYGEQIDQVQASDKAAEAGAGITIGYGTSADIDSDNKVAGMNNVLQIQRAAQNQAVGYENQAINIRLGGSQAQLQSGLNASAQQYSGVMSAAGTLMAGYANSESTGKGSSSRTGTDSSPVYGRQATIAFNSTGDGVVGSPTTYSNGYGWYPDANDTASGYPGFFGQGPRSAYSGGSFTGETA